MIKVFLLVKVNLVMMDCKIISNVFQPDFKYFTTSTCGDKILDWKAKGL